MIEIFNPRNGRLYTSDMKKPFVVKFKGHDRYFRTLKAARKAAPAGSTIFFDYAPKTGVFIEHVGW